jgi:membrane protein
MPGESATTPEAIEGSTGIPRIDRWLGLDDRSAPLNRWQRFAHFWMMVWTSFVRNRCPVRASALAYASLLALVPMLAVVASVAVSLLKKDGEERSKQLIETLVSSLTTPTVSADPGAAARGNADSARADAARREIVERVNEYVNSVRSGTIGATGMVVLLFMAIGMLSRIEDTFNDIWGVTRGRNWFSRVVQYWAALTLGPLLLMCALALTSSPFFATTKRAIEALPLGAGEALMFAFKFLPFVIMGGAFMVFYQLMPNTRVDWRAALVGGVVGGTLWQVNNLLSVFYVSRVVSHEKIYGSLGMVPVVMIGLYLSWMILLFGAQVAYVFQNRQAFLSERAALRITEAGREFIALRVMTMVGLRFREGRSAPTSSEIARALSVPSQLTSKVVEALISADLLREISGAEHGYLPARPLNAMTAHDVMTALRGIGLPETTDGPLRETVAEEIGRIQLAEKQCAAATTLENLVARAQERLTNRAGADQF